MALARIEQEKKRDRNFEGRIESEQVKFGTQSLETYKAYGLGSDDSL